MQGIILIKLINVVCVGVRYTKVSNHVELSKFKARLKKHRTAGEFKKKRFKGVGCLPIGDTNIREECIASVSEKNFNNHL